MSGREKKLKQRIDDLKARRASNWDALYQDVADNVRPDSATFSGMRTLPVSNSHIFDTTAPESAITLASALSTFLTNPATKWFSLRQEEDAEEDDESLEWLETVNKIMHRAITDPNAGFTTNIHETFIDYTLFGYGGLFLGYRPPGETVAKGFSPRPEGLSFKAIPASELYLAEGPDGYVDTTLRVFTYTVRQCMAVWGESNSKNVKDKAKKGSLEDKIEIAHLISPREDVGSSASKPTMTSSNLRGDGGEDFPKVAVYFDTDAGHIIEESGFNSLPVLTPRFFKTGSEVYGRSPGTEALPSIKTLNAMAASLLRITNMIAEPPIIATDNSVVGRFGYGPRTITYIKPGLDRPEPLNVTGNPQFALERMSSLTQSIRRMFFNDLLQLQQGPQMTAREVVTRNSERFQILSAVLGRLITELLDPLVSRVFELLLINNLFPEMPISLASQELEVFYDSPFARARLDGDIQALNDTLLATSPLAQAKPGMLDLLDGDEIMRGVARVSGLPSKFIRSREEVEALRAEQAQQQSQQQQLDSLEQGGRAAAALSQAGMNIEQTGEGEQ